MMNFHPYSNLRLSQEKYIYTLTQICDFRKKSIFTSLRMFAEVQVKL